MSALLRVCLASNHDERFCALNAAIVPGNANAWCARTYVAHGTPLRTLLRGAELSVRCWAERAPGRLGGSSRVGASLCVSLTRICCTVDAVLALSLGPKSLDFSQYIQADLERPRRILGVSIQGRGDAPQWVTEFRVVYRNAHGKPWKRVRRTFTGSQDQNTVVRHSLRGDYITARYIRLIPMGWSGHMSLRWDVDYTSAHTDGAAERAADAAAARMDEIENAEMQKVAMVKALARGRVKVSTSYGQTHSKQAMTTAAARAAALSLPQAGSRPCAPARAVVSREVPAVCAVCIEQLPITTSDSALSAHRTFPVTPTLGARERTLHNAHPAERLSARRADRCALRHKYHAWW